MASQNTQTPTNFSHLRWREEQLLRLGELAERYLADDPNTSLMKARQFGEVLAQTVAARMGLYRAEGESQHDLLRRLHYEGVLTREIFQLFDKIRYDGNKATHEIKGNYDIALNALRLAWRLSVWFERTFFMPDFQAGEFVTPTARPDETAELRAQLEKLTAETAQAKAVLAQHQAEAKRKQVRSFAKYKRAAEAASERLTLSEAETRYLIDQQLRLAGWEADSRRLRFADGIRPERGRNMAIAEWPTASGPADYVLFLGLMPIAVVEAKRANADVPAALVQAKRYSRDIQLDANSVLGGGPWGEYQIPFLFSTNGRPYLRQMETLSGIWFVDVRQPTNFSRALDGWYSPDGLRELLKRDEVEAQKFLALEPFEYGFTLRHYQQAAIRAVENAVGAGQRSLLVAMATGTGKTKTCIALIYRLLKVKRFRRILFLVDREALGEQAANAFKDTRMDSIQSFADIFGIKELGDTAPESETAVHIATVQGMVRRVLFAAEDQPPPPVDEYDCIVVDECHRGYLLDRELSDTELSFRSYDDYVSKYRRVLDYFDAVKIGLTATPALHTTQIFGRPVFTYSYREAVVDGYLVDYEPPIQIKTKLSEAGIQWQAGETVKVYDPARQQIDLMTTPDEIYLEVEAFNRRVVTQEFNRTVCAYLAREIDPALPQKTLVFCANDQHADLVVQLLKQAYADQYGVEDDSILKITGTADKPLELIRRFKNERQPSIVVTVDLLTTGVDVPTICNLVFLRRVNSRILYDQMLGRATRLCPEIGKESFRVFDAVRLYEALAPLSEMKPVVVDPQISFSQLMAELTTAQGEAAQNLIRDQFLAKLQRKKNRLNEKNARDFEMAASMPAEAFLQKLREMPTSQLAVWFTENPQLGEILDRINPDPRPRLFSEHRDELLSAEQSFGTEKPEDYLEAFTRFIREKRDEIPALVTVLTRPRELTRRHLRELALALDQAGFDELKVTAAWRKKTNQEIAAHLVGFIRHLAANDELLPYPARVEAALQRLLVAQTWTTPQREWLKKIAKQTAANTLVDREALDDPDLIFRREGGGFIRLDKLFGGRLAETLATFNELIWEQA